MFYLLFAIYFLVALYVLPKAAMMKRSGLTPTAIRILFSITVVAGIAIGWITGHFYPGNDYRALNQDGLVEYNLLVRSPREFFTNIFYSPYSNGYNSVFNSIGSYWNDLRYNIILKFLAVFDIFSRGNYYINSLFFNFFKMFGVVALYRVFADIYPRSKMAVLIGCFLLPSTLYFSSGIHKDLVVFLLVGLYCYGLYFLKKDRLSAGRAFTIFFSFIGIFLMRNYVAIFLIPPSIGFLLSGRFKRAWTSYFIVYAAGMLLIAVIQLIVPQFQPLNVVLEKQEAFLDLPTASSELKHLELKPTSKSFLLNLPAAFEHGLLRPFFWKTGKALLPLALEVLIYEVLLLLFFFRRGNISAPFAWFGIFFSLSLMLLTGYIIPNEGSIVRYRSIYFPFLIIPILAPVLTHIKFNNIRLIFR